MTACALYRAFDLHGELLYIGITINPESRMAAHRSATPWWRDNVARVDVTWHADAAAASIAELQAIQTESPKWNRAGVDRAYIRHGSLSQRVKCPAPVGRILRFLSVGEVAERTGLSLHTVKAYSQNTPRLMPNPDAMVGRVKGWKPATIDAWHNAKRAKQAERR